MSAPQYIYEVVDASNEEQYWSLGVFLTQDDAMRLLDGEEPPYRDDDPDSVIIEVRRRPVGFYPHEWTKVASRVWIRQYEDDAPDWVARAIRTFEVKSS